MGIDEGAQASASMSVRLLMVANEELEALYLMKPQPCLALALCRNYNLLSQNEHQSSQRLSWIQKTKYWWQVYLKQCTGKPIDSLLYRAESGLLFEPINL